MRRGLDEKLCADFPLLYRDRRGDKSKTCMCWGFPGDGWEPIIRKLSAKLEALIAALPADERDDCRAEQVKEKFGILRVYLTTTSDAMEACIREAEEESARTCETCGAPGKLRGKGWLYVSCQAHLRPGV